MESSLHDQMINTDFLRLSAKRLAILAIVVLLPFSINSIFQQRLIVGIGSLAIVLLLAFNAWSLNKGRNTHNLTFYVLVPGIIFFMALTFKQQGIVGALWWCSVAGFTWSRLWRYGWSPPCWRSVPLPRYSPM